jgi:hypothetical protein
MLQAGTLAERMMKANIANQKALELIEILKFLFYLGNFSLKSVSRGAVSNLYKEKQASHLAGCYI